MSEMKIAQMNPQVGVQRKKAPFQRYSIGMLKVVIPHICEFVNIQHLKKIDTKLRSQLSP